MGVMQAQDYAMSKWAIGVRLPKSTDKMVEAASDKGEILRTHLLRPTWHWMAADDIYWMLELVAAQVKSSLKPRQKELELTDKTFSKAGKIIEKVLLDSNHLTREELAAELENGGIKLTGERATHLLVYAELDGLICSGAAKGNKQTYALLQKRVPTKKSLGRDEALAVLAKRYFESHGPATVQDFIWWSGLNITDGKKALEIVKAELSSVQIGAEWYWFSQSFEMPKRKKNLVNLLPAFDEFIISYKDRTASLLSEHFKHAISNNGIFRPVIVVDGKVVGLWKRMVVKDVVNIEASFFTDANKTIHPSIEKAAKDFGKFIGKTPQVIIEDFTS